MALIRRWVLGLILSLALPAAGFAEPPAVTAADRVLGRADAPVTVIEYASVTCPHCAAWHNEVFPDFKARFIDTGRVRFVYREFLTQPVELFFGGALLARCAPVDRFFDVVDALMEHQPALYASGDANAWLVAGARAGGLDAVTAGACLRDPDGAEVLNRRLEAAVAAGIESSPTFFINGVVFRGRSLAEFDAALARVRPAN